MKEQKEKKVRRKEDNREELKINVHNDAEMVGLKLRLRPIIPRDISIWTKTDREKEELKLVRSSGMVSTNWSAPIYSVDFPGKLIVYLKGFPRVRREGKDFPNQIGSTVSHNCKLCDIDTILARYKKAELEIVKYAWNGRTYKYGTLPVRLNRGGRVTA